MKKPDYKQAESLGFWLAIPGAVVVGIAANQASALPWIVGIALIAAGMGIMFGFCRCPHCKGYLGRNTNASFCPHCGEKLK